MCQSSLPGAATSKGKPQNARCAVANRKDSITLDKKWNGNHEDPCRLVNDRFGLEPEEQHDGKQQSDNRRRFETRRECVDRLGPPFRRSEERVAKPAPSGTTTKIATDAISVAQGTVRSVTPREQASDRGEREDQDEVVDGDLGEGVVGVAVGELAPHKHHRSAWGDPEQDHARDVFVCFARRDEISEHESEEQVRQAGHCERFDQPVDRAVSRSAPWAAGGRRSGSRARP